MRFRNQIAWTLLLQGGGAAAGLASIALLGIYLGPAAQGAFSLVKIEVSFVGALAILGLTQSLFYYVQSSRLSIGRAKDLAVVMAVLGGLIALGYGVLVQRWSGDVLVAFAFAGAAYAWFGCLRGVVLAAATTRLFNVMTVLPQGLLLLYAGAAVLVGRVNYFDASLAFTASYGLSAVIGLRWLAGASQSIPRPVVMEARLPSVFRYGFASGVSEVAATVSLLLAVKAVAGQLGPVELGVFTLAVTLAQGVLLPVNYTAPLLFKRWMERPDASAVMQGGILVVAMLGGFSLVIRYLLSDIEPGSWLGEYSSMADVLWIVLLAAAFDGCQKVVAVYANAQGAPWLSATSETLRLVVVATGLALWPIQHAKDVAWIICIAALVSSSMLFAVHRRMEWATEGLAK